MRKPEVIGVVWLVLMLLFLLLQGWVRERVWRREVSTDRSMALAREALQRDLKQNSGGPSSGSLSLASDDARGATSIAKDS